jgi:hypothetical protein
MRKFKNEVQMIRTLVLTLAVFIPTYYVWALESAENTNTPVVATTTPTQVKKEKLTMVQTPGVKKDFKWFFKYGCSCAQCKAFQQQQIDEQERLKNNFQP